MFYPQHYINKALACFMSVVIMGVLIIDSKATAEQTLGHFPVCEASAALILPCPNAKGQCLLLGDNEQRKELFLFQIQDRAVISESQKALNLQLSDGEELSDIEALAHVSTGKILIFCSYSRNSKCQAKKKRRQFATVQISSKGASVIKKVQSKKIGSCWNLGEML